VAQDGVTPFQWALPPPIDETADTVKQQQELKKIAEAISVSVLLSDVKLVQHPIMEDPPSHSMDS